MRKSRGQSILEYCCIAIIVILGIVIMGPYVLRSIDAHFKLWGEGARDSFTEQIQQAPATAVPDLPLNCSCPATEGGCGSAAAGPFGCGPTQMEWHYNCTPQGCNGDDGDFYCVNDPSCCVKQPLGCGSYPCPSSGCNLGSSPPAQGSTCYYGYDVESNVCGSGDSGTLGAINQGYTCTADSKCLPVCKGTTSAQQTNINQGYAAPCPGAAGTPAGTTPLTQDEDVNFVQTETPQPGSLSWCSGAPCQYYCTNGAFDSTGVCASAPACDIVQVIPLSPPCGGGGAICVISPAPHAETAAWICFHAGFHYLVDCEIGFSGTMSTDIALITNKTGFGTSGDLFPIFNNPANWGWLRSSGQNGATSINGVYCSNDPSAAHGATCHYCAPPAGESSSCNCSVIPTGGECSCYQSQEFE